jgi:GNAT superfamily N-acetyltransferase
VIRSAEPRDLPALARLMASSPLLLRYRTTYDGALTALHAALADGDALLVEGEPVAGLAWLSFAPRILNGAAYLRLLLVAEHTRAGGLGTNLLIAAEQHSRLSARHLYLLVTSDNLGARRFYERHGYRHVGDLPGLVWPDLDEALYHKPLTGEHRAPDSG